MAPFYTLHVTSICVSKASAPIFFKFALPFGNESTFSGENMMIFRQNSEYIYLKITMLFRAGMIVLN